MSDLSERLSRLSPAKLEALARLTQTKPSGARRSRAIPRRSEPGPPAPLSSAQERLWFLHEVNPESAVYHAPAIIRLAGTLDPDALERSLNEIVRRHEVLRTTFANVEGRPLQTVRDAGPLALRRFDLCETPRAGREEAARGLVEAEAWRPFDLTDGPALRASLVRCDEREHILLLAMHHIVFDGQSFGPLLGELAALYRAFSAGEPSPLAELPIQYADYACWQREWLKGADCERRLAYWVERLGGELPALQLPTDKARPSVQSFRGARASLRLSRDCSGALAGLARREGVTLFMLLLAAFQVLLHRYTGQEEIVVGTVASNRARPGLEGLIGFFVNTLVMRARLSGALTFKELLKQTRESAAEAYEHGEAPFEKLVERLRPARDPSHSPLFQVMFILQDAPGAAEAAGLEMTLFEPPDGVSKFDLTLEVTNFDDGLRATFEYNTDLFGAATVERMLGHLRTVLEAVAADPARRVSDLPLLTEDERRRMLVEWNQTEAEYQRERCAHELFEAQAELSPEAAALVYEDGRLTYAELNASANRLAHHLRKLGVGPETLVGLFAERSPEMVAAVLGVLKAGGAYVPLDPAYPKQRLSYMLADSRLSLLLTQERLLDKLPPHEVAVVLLDAGRHVAELESSENPRVPVAPENLAYAIYTSGSTAQPKGVLLAHRGLSNLSAAQARAFGVGPGSRVLQFSSLSFDASVWEMVMALTTGGCLCLGGGATDSGQGAGDGGALRALRAQRATVATLPPSVLASLPEDDFPELRTLISAGESCTGELVARWARGRDFFNAYGPTETTVCASLTRCLPSDDREPTIGRPVANFSLYVLDRYGNPAPVGVHGELHVGGPGLARGYLGRPELTAEKFIPDPFGREAGARLYRTGDLVRYLPDGRIEFLGRLDQQVKVRGFRIELGEIEAALGGFPHVRQAMAVAREGRSGDKRLVAYIVAERGQNPTVEDLRAHLRERLPDYMIPSAFVLLDEWPMTPNGKIDRRSLPDPEGPRPTLQTAYVEPQTHMERKLSDLWREVLGVDEVGLDDDFFSLGGHSLLLLRMQKGLREVAREELSLIELFRYPTVRSLAGRLSRGEAEAAESAPGRQRGRAANQRSALLRRMEQGKGRRDAQWSESKGAKPPRS
jgi:amino acid adenylation domain-containing protein